MLSLYQTLDIRVQAAHKIALIHSKYICDQLA